MIGKLIKWLKCYVIFNKWVEYVDMEIVKDLYFEWDVIFRFIF